MPTRRTFFKAVPFGALGAAAPAPAQQSARPEKGRPNILILMSDQHRAGLTRRSGYPLDTMPTLDRLAALGVAFDRAYTTAPLCAPARCSLMTGRWPQAHRVRENSATRFAYFEQDLVDVVKPLGYKTAMVGKNHSHLTAQKLDYWREYSHLFGWIPDGAPPQTAAFDNWMRHLNHGVSQEPTPFPLETQMPHRIVSNAIEFLDGAGDAPFLLWVSFPEPHNPYQVPAPYFDLFPPAEVPERAAGREALEGQGFKWQWLRDLQERAHPGIDQSWRRLKSNYLGMLRLIDDQIARLARHLEQTRRMENTLIVYLTDHGDYLTDYGLIRKGVGMPEALTRIPMVWSGWGVQPIRNPPEFVSTADVMPTLCEAAGAEIPRGAQGRSLWPLLQGRDYPRDEFRSIYAELGFGGLHYDATDRIDPRFGTIPNAPGAIPTFDELNPVTQSGYMKMVRMGDWKLTFDMMGSGALYHLPSDPLELKNRFNDPAAGSDQMRLMTELLAWIIRTQDNLPTAAYQAKWAPHNWYAPYRRGRE